MKALIVGGGSIGTRHLRNLKCLGVECLSVVEPDLQRKELLQETEKIPVFDDLDKGLNWKPDLVVIATPTYLHMEQALLAARQGCHLFIEKPLSHTMKGVEELIEIVQKNHLITLIGCNWRFHHGPATLKQLLENNAIGRPISAILDAGQYLPDWHSDEDYRRLYSTRQSMGGGVILDGIHEIDYARWLFGEVTEVFCYGGKIGHLEIDVEDSANILLKLKAGFSIMVHIDYLQRTYARFCKIIGEEGTIIWDIANSLRWFSIRTQNWNTLSPPEGYTLNEMYLEEMKYLLNCIAHRKKTMLDVQEAARVTKIALAVKESMESGKKVSCEP